jgi:hypothetical protein
MRKNFKQVARQMHQLAQERLHPIDRTAWEDLDLQTKLRYQISAKVYVKMQEMP